MNILVPSAEPGVLQDAETMRTYNPAIGAYQDCKSILAPENGVWREVWPDKYEKILYDTGTFYENYVLSSSPWSMLSHSFGQSYISTSYGSGDSAMIFNFASPIQKMQKVCVDLNYFGGHIAAAGFAILVKDTYSVNWSGEIESAECYLSGKPQGLCTAEMDLTQLYENKYLSLRVSYINSQITKIWVEA